MRLRRKERAAATANSNRPVKIKLHVNNSSTSGPQNQERFSQNNVIILRNLNCCKVIFQSIAHMQELMSNCFGITENEFWDSLGYLTHKGYIIQLPANVNFIITHPAAMTSPIKIADYKQHENPQGINGWLVEGHIYYDAFVLKNKKSAIYVSTKKKATTTPPKTETPESQS